MNSEYEQKFAGFIEMCKGAKKGGAEGVLVSHPSVLGDTYEELIESLSRIADAGIGLHIAGRFPTDG